MVRWADHPEYFYYNDSAWSSDSSYDQPGPQKRHWFEFTDEPVPELTDHHAAFRFLEPAYDANSQYPDDYVIALAGVKRAEYDEAWWQAKVDKAVSLIAEHRNSDHLRAFASTGEVPATSEDDDLTAAYRFYNISDRTGELDTDVLALNRDFIIDDSSESTERKVRATQYFDLLQKNHKKAEPVPVMADYTKPVGLENQANYCYLHALLQYFNSIGPFRDTILDFDTFKQPIETASTTDLGKIGGETITASRVEDGQKLVPYLERLFKSLRSSAAPHTRIPPGLAAEALNPPPQDLSASQLLPEKAENAEDAANNDENLREAVDTPVSEMVKSDKSSDITLVGDVIMTPESEADEQQTEETSKIVEETAATDKLEEKKDSDGDKASPPSRPPPVPPRPKPTPKDEATAEEYRQQDAHQVAGNVIQRTIAAIKPTSIDADGERQDHIRDLFFGLTQQICTDDSVKKIKFPESYDTYQYIHLSRKPKDVQEGLDMTYGLETNEEGDTPEDERWKAYYVMKHAPPLLQLYLQNRESGTTLDGTSFRSARVAHHMKLNESIHLDRYMEGSPMLPLREESWVLRDRLEKLEKAKEDRRILMEKAKKKADNKYLEIDDAYSALSNIMKVDAEDGPLDEKSQELMDLLGREAQTIASQRTSDEAEIEDARAKLDALPLNQADTEALRYRIFAIFMYVYILLHYDSSLILVLTHCIGIAVMATAVIGGSTSATSRTMSGVLTMIKPFES